MNPVYGGDYLIASEGCPIPWEAATDFGPLGYDRSAPDPRKGRRIRHVPLV